MLWPDDREVPEIERPDLGSVQPFGKRDDGRITRPKREVGVLVDEVGHPCVVALGQLHWHEVLLGQ